MAPDLYAILEVDRKVGVDEIKKAYRRQALRWHPDRNPGDKNAERRFKEVTYAYSVLSDARQRRQYDTFGRVFAGGRAQGPFGASEEVDLGEMMGAMFRDLFGRKRGGPSSSRDLRYTVTVSLEEVLTGTRKDVAFERRAADGAAREERLRVRVPAGVETGQKLKINGKGAGRGDLLVVVNVAEHAVFRRRGRDLFCDAPVSYVDAVLGAEIKVPTLEGTAVVRLPARSQPGTVLTLRDRGLPHLSRSRKRGDLFVKIRLDMPGTIDPGTEEELRALDARLRDLPSEDRRRFDEVLAEREHGAQA